MRLYKSLTGARIVTPNYIDACLQAGFLVDDADFALNDTVCDTLQCSEAASLEQLRGE